MRYSKWPWFALAYLFFVPACLVVVPASTIDQWHLTILATEYGHFFGFLGLVACVWLALKKRGAALWVPLVPVMLGTVLFFVPVVQSLQIAFTVYPREMKNLLPQTEIATPPFWRLASLLRTSEVPYQKLEFSKSPSLNLLYYPGLGTADSGQPKPIVVVVHGGGWDSGDADQVPELNWLLARNGYNVVSVEYRLAPDAKWPAQREDVLSAITWLRGHASELNIDPERMALIGRSAGGQIAQSLAYQNPPTGLKALVAFYAPSDLEFGYVNAVPGGVLDSHKLIEQYLGGTPEAAHAAYVDSSPLNFASAFSTPTLLLHGYRDELVWYRHSRRLAAKLHEFGVPVAHIEMPWATHGFDFNLNGPGGILARAAILQFFAARL